MATSWRAIVEAAMPGASRARGASRAARERIGSALSVSIPAELDELLSETNGVSVDGLSAVWSAGEIVEQNRQMRNEVAGTGQYQPFDDLLFVGEAGDGDLFALGPRAKRARLDPVLRWDHETDERVPFAKGLREYLRRFAREVLDPDAAAASGASARVVSVFLGSHESPEALLRYCRLVPSETGSARSPFMAEFQLALEDLLKVETHQLLSLAPAPPAELLADAPGAESFAAAALARAAELGLERPTSGLLLYGLRYEPRDARSAFGEMRFLGVYELE